MNEMVQAIIKYELLSWAPVIGIVCTFMARDIIGIVCMAVVIAFSFTYIPFKIKLIIDLILYGISAWTTAAGNLDNNIEGLLFFAPVIGFILTFIVLLFG